MLTVDRNAEGAWRVSAEVRDPQAVDSFFSVSAWLETRTFYGYTKAEAQRMFRQHVKANGWRVAR